MNPLSPPKYWRLLALFLCSGLTFTASSQTETDTTFRYQMNTIFGPLEMGRVPYGLLRDYAMELAALSAYSGTTNLVDSNCVFPASFWSIYNTLTSARVNDSSNFLKRSGNLDTLWYNTLKTDTIVLSGLYVRYSRFKDNAYPTYLTVNNNKIYDKYVSGVWQNPYQSETLFAISPPQIVFGEPLTLKILLPANLWQSNGSYSSISIDAGDGLGYRSLTTGTVLSITYSTTGIKEWKYRLTLSGSNYLYAHTLISVGRPASTP